MFPNKDKMSHFLSSNVVYKFNCEHCRACYIGETKRHLSTRVHEHITGKPSPTEISLHVHVAKQEHFTILARTKYTKIAEALYIKNEHSELLNERNASYPLSLF